MYTSQDVPEALPVSSTAGALDGKRPLWSHDKVTRRTRTLRVLTRDCWSPVQVTLLGSISTDTGGGRLLDAASKWRIFGWHGMIWPRHFFHLLGSSSFIDRLGVDKLEDPRQWQPKLKIELA